MLKKYDYLNKVTEYIEDNINEEMNLAEVAKAGFVSLMQLYRDFYTYTGHSLKEYIRKRRLSNGCAMIKHTDASLVEIAISNGYETQQSFCKYFKSVLGITPLEYRNSDVYFSFYPLNFEHISLPVKVETQTIPMVISCRYYSSQQNGIENRAVSRLLEIIKNRNRLSDEVIRLFGRDGKPKGDEPCYELMVAPSGNIDVWVDVLRESVFNDVSIINQTTAVFASCTVQNVEKDITSGWNYLYNLWLKNSMFALDDREYFEEYCFKGQIPNKLKLLLPVKKRSNYRMIIIEDMPAMTFLISKKVGINSEETASKCVMQFLADHYPPMIKEMSAFYVACYKDAYECGIKLDKDIDLPANGDVEVIRYPEGRYAKVNDVCYGDVNIHAEQLKYWLAQNGFLQANQKVFAIYEIHDGCFELSSITMTVCTQLKNVKNG